MDCIIGILDTGNIEHFMMVREKLVDWRELLV